MSRSAARRPTSRYHRRHPAGDRTAKVQPFIEHRPCTFPTPRPDYPPPPSPGAPLGPLRRPRSSLSWPRARQEASPRSAIRSVECIRPIQPRHPATCCAPAHCIAPLARPTSHLHVRRPSPILTPRTTGQAGHTYTRSGLLAHVVVAGGGRERLLLHAQ